MAAKTRLSQDSNILDPLKELLNLVKDPNLIISAYETARKQSELSDSELIRIEDGRKFIAKYESLLADHKKNIDELTAKQGLHEKTVSEFEKYKQITTDRLKTWEDTLESFKGIQDKKAADLVADRASVDNDRVNIDKIMKQLIAERKQIDSDRADTNALMQCQQSERAELDNIRKKINEKTKKIKEQLANMDD